MMDTVIRCDYCEIIMEKESKKFEGKEYCPECFRQKFKKVRNDLLKELISDLEWNEERTTDNDIIMLYLGSKIEK